MCTSGGGANRAVHRVLGLYRTMCGAAGVMWVLEYVCGAWHGMCVVGMLHARGVCCHVHGMPNGCGGACRAAHRFMGLHRAMWEL